MKILDENDEKMVFEATGQTHTLCNILRKRLMLLDEVKAAAYDITHPLVGQPEFEISAENPRQSIITAAETIKDESQEFKKAVEEAF